MNEAMRLKYRYLDLRRPDMQAGLLLRHRVKIARDYFDAEGFIGLRHRCYKSSPEAQRLLVPSRVHPGKFFALPQSPRCLSSF